MKYRFLLGAVVGLTAALSWADAHAQLVLAPPGPGAFYVGGEGGWTALPNQKATVAGASSTIHYDDGFNLGVRAGYLWGPWRFEEEFRWQRNDISSLGSFGVQGASAAYAIMTNAIYDFNVGFPVTPHLGAGIGAVDLVTTASVPGSIGPFPGGQLIHGNDWEFGYQAIAGIRYNINPSLALDLDYRYLATVDAKYKTGSALGNLPVSSGYASHNLLASLSLIFGAAPPPPPPVAAPAVAPAPPPTTRKVFLVFFDWDRDTITPEGMAIVHQAADAFKEGHPVQIQVTGYTDRSGSPGYNQRLSERRANNVARALVRFGVPRSAMTVSGRGENDNRVPTANGVREPQNRRVEIVFP